MNRPEVGINKPTKVANKADSIVSTLIRVDSDVYDLESIVNRLHGTPAAPSTQEMEKNTTLSVVHLMDHLPPSLISISERIRDCIRRLDEGLC
jgi:hypothetical protein